ncbi:C-X-C motif chemokine 3-like isoform X1 [Xiphophorus couchianus]|uniref:C-X-C motif chemokine 3-like isoform X1 n=1 Tax=Xiphophorus couchianus TaxID=32473 RepID=UPI001016ADD8|nr:C-X-C motif chemokine 3-like isoform X1 [Xiphophorus couchianus]
MNSGIRCIVLLACITICSSASIMRCKCIKTISAVRTHLIADAKVYKPVPSCSQQEVIVILKDKTQLCLDPAGRQAQDIIRILEAKEMQAKAKQTSSVNTKATTAATTTTAAIITSAATTSAATSPPVAAAATSTAATPVAATSPPVAATSL